MINKKNRFSRPITWKIKNSIINFDCDNYLEVGIFFCFQSFSYANFSNNMGKKPRPELPETAKNPKKNSNIRNWDQYRLSFPSLLSLFQFTISQVTLAVLQQDCKIKIYNVRSFRMLIWLNTWILLC